MCEDFQNPHYPEKIEVKLIADHGEIYVSLNSIAKILQECPGIDLMKHLNKHSISLQNAMEGMPTDPDIDVDLNISNMPPDAYGKTSE